MNNILSKPIDVHDDHYHHMDVELPNGPKEDRTYNFEDNHPRYKAHESDRSPTPELKIMEIDYKKLEDSPKRKPAKQPKVAQKPVNKPKTNQVNKDKDENFDKKSVEPKNNNNSKVPPKTSGKNDKDEMDKRSKKIKKLRSNTPSIEKEKKDLQ